MIVGHSKPLAEIWEQVKGFKKVLVLGCGECVTVCHAGGEKEVEILAQSLRLKAQSEGGGPEFMENTIQRQCEPEFVQPILADLQGADAVLSIACGVGVNFLADRDIPVPVFPGLNTTFMGACEEHGVFVERCAGCGECILDLTGGICPVARCAKTILNGPCGGTKDGKCEVSTPDKEVDCVWYLIVERAKKLGTLETLRTVLASKDWSPSRHGGPRKHVRPDLVIRESAEEDTEEEPIRKLPEDPYHLGAMSLNEPASGEKCGSALEKQILAGNFAVTAELGPPMDANAEEVKHKMEILRGYADGVNLTDCQTAVVRLSSIAAATMLVQAGIEPVMQMTTRDRNRIAIQADILGAAALGIKNCLCIAGDHQSFSATGKLNGHPGAKNVYDIDSIQLTAALKRMRDEGKQEGGDPMEVPPKLFIGAAWTPMGDPVDWRVDRLEKKVAAGADFIQTQGVFDIAAFSEIMKEVRNRGLHEKTAILAGIIVPKSAGMLRFMNNFVPGIKVPKEMIDRFPKTRKSDPPEVKKENKAKSTEIAKQITIELIQQCQEIEGIRGVHIQAIEWEEAVPEIVKGAGLHPRPAV